MRRRAPWNWNQFFKKVGRGAVTGAAAEVMAAGTLHGMAFVGGATIAAVGYVYDWSIGGEQ